VPRGRRDARPESYGNTIKRVADIAWAHGAGITLFAADAEEELEKIAEHAPGAQVYIRVIVEVSMADWPLTRKFGCDRDTALRLLDHAKALGLTPVGFSFHVGSQTRKAEMWRPTLDAVAELWADAKAAGTSSSSSTSAAASRPSTARRSRLRPTTPRA
jgi:ornithine decarboxylase